MNEINQIAEYLFSDLIKKGNYPYQKEIINTVRFLTGDLPASRQGNKEGHDPLAGEGLNQINQEKKTVSGFFETAAKEAAKEFAEMLRDNPHAGKTAVQLSEALKKDSGRSEYKDKLVLKLFHPEAYFSQDSREKGVETLRERRNIRITELNKNPVLNPAEELIFTSNFILTVPVSEEMLEKASLSEDLKKEIKLIMKDKQDFWFDHPVPIGIPDENNELIYGLKHLAETLDYEKTRGTCPEDSRLTVIISVSVTHDRLKNILHRYMDEGLKKASDFNDLDIYIFTENDTESLINRILIPAAEKKGLKEDVSLKEVFGVDGEYGRHYSFLKAIAPLWQIIADRRKIGTFKIDLDQVFPENELAGETGKSAFEHFMSPLWGAAGKDWKGRNIKLGMIAGSLVNEKDIHKSIFEPDVPYPDRTPDGEERIFFKQYPMALSTEAEMNLKKYMDSETCQMRYHVTGGTNGILNSALRKYRPFTPSFIGRAEDQGYILSVLFSSRNSDFLRYLHQPGLKMRHDKEAFISDAIKSAKTGTYIGDLVRIMAFSAYSDIVEGNIDQVKDETDPFTGSFISRIPAALVLFKLLLHIYDELKKDIPAKEKEIYLEKLISSAAERLGQAFNFFKDRERLKNQFEKEKAGWDLYYNTIEFIEKEINEKSEFADFLKSDSEKIFKRCRL